MFWIFKVSEFIVFGIKVRFSFFHLMLNPSADPELRHVPGSRWLRRVETINRCCEIDLPEELCEQEGTACVWHD